MNLVILLGAGFSRNWGGWLADEVFDHLLFSPEVASDPELKDIIWRNSDAGFESALETVQQEAAADTTSAPKRQRLDAIQRALIRMFREMNEAFFNEPDFEFKNEVGSTVREFLARFDAIFTLNQDALLEYHYVDNYNVSLVSPRRWDAVQIPGMRRIPVDEPLFHSSWARAEWRPLPDAEYMIAPRCQPYIKLHGSANWFTADGQRLLVMGGDKSGQIQNHKILRRYAAEFRGRIGQPDTRLMIIGYGFRDHHINRVIKDAVYKQGLRFFVITPKGRNAGKVFSESVHAGAALAAYGYDLEAVFRQGLIGASQRSLREIFAGGGPDHERLMQFAKK